MGRVIQFIRRPDSPFRPSAGLPRPPIYRAVGVAPIVVLMRAYRAAGSVTQELDEDTPIDTWLTAELSRE